MRVEWKAEWLETDGLGGFASGVAGLLRTRRYHALLMQATTPPTGRFVLVNGLEAFVTTPAGSWPISVQAYAPGVIHPEGHRFLQAFDPDPWPRWRFALPDGTTVEQTIATAHGRPATTIGWRLARPRAGVTLTVRLLVSGRDYHSLHRENGSFRFDAESEGERVLLRPYGGVPAIEALSNGAFFPEPVWYRGFLYEQERARGLDCVEDLASPGRFVFDLGRGEACMVLSAVPPGCAGASAGERAGAAAGARVAGAASERAGGAAAAFKTLRAAERRRRERFPTRLHRAADAYLVRRGDGGTIVAGYPWFTDWGRDTFIALRGLCLATGRLDAARAILLEWAGAVSRGMLPNRFPDRGEEPEFNSVDASLWYLVAVHDWTAAMRASGRPVAKADETTLRRAMEAILTGYADGTRYGIRAAGDGLLQAGEPGVALTWMDARVGGRAITPRIGKPVEIECLWINALAFGSDWSPRWKELHRRALDSFRERFPIRGGRGLYDVVDADHAPGRDDASLRPNQIFAVGGLPFPLLEGEEARAVVDLLGERLLTPIGLRTLDPADPAYRGRYEGGPEERDAAYHQGTVWPWLLGPYVEAWVRVRGGSAAVRREARRLFLDPLVQHLDDAGIDHLSEIADGDPPHAPRGCPFQAWSVGEALRLSLAVLNEEDRTAAGRTARTAKRRPSTKRAKARGADPGAAGRRAPRKRRPAEPPRV